MIILEKIAPKEPASGSCLNSPAGDPSLRSALISGWSVWLCTTSSHNSSEYSQAELLHVSHYLRPFGTKLKLLIRGPEHVMTAKQIFEF